MADFQISGLSSGIDWGGIVDKLIENRRQPETAWKKEQQKLADKENLYNELTVYFNSLKDSLSSLRMESTFLKKEAAVTAIGSSSGSASPVLTAEASPLAEIGRSQIEVVSLAQAHRVASSRFQSTDSPLGKSGSFSLAVGDFSFSVSLLPEQGLSALAEGINQAVGHAAAERGVSIPLRALVLDNTLILKGEATGEEFRIRAEDPDGILKDLGILDGSGDFAKVLQEPADAVLRVDGLEVRRSSNSIRDVLQGVTLDLNSPGTVNLDVSLDAKDAVESVRSTVEAYNATLDWINKRLEEKPVESPQNAIERQRGLLRGDSLLWTSKQSLREIVMMPTGSLTLSRLGIRTESADFGKSGKLEFDESAFMENMKSDPKAVADTLKTFADRLGAVSEGMVSRSTVLVGGTSVKKGRLIQQVDSLEKQSGQIDGRIKDLEARLALQRASLEALYSEMEASLAKLTQQAGMLSIFSSGLSSSSFGSSGSNSSSD